MKSHVLGFALLSAIAIVASSPAQAQNGSLTRSFVSSAGLDTNSCMITAPCATFAHAYTTIGANGIIAAIDPGKYGPIAITGPVTINGNGWAAITATATGAGITIAAGSGNNVTLTGLEIDGAGAAYNGIVFNTGGNLVVRNCVLKDFVKADFSGTNGNGILIAPASGTFTFTIVDTIVTNSGYAGIIYLPPSGSATATGVIDHVVATGSISNGGIGASMANASGGTVAISISNSVISNNTGNGVFTAGTVSGIAMTLDNDEISYNAFGILNNPGSTMVLGRSTITNNSDYGIYNNSTLDTFKNNQIYANGNSNAVGGSALTTVLLQ
jgi:hypothetical protein